MGKQLVITLYRSFLRNAKTLDSRRAFKALLPRQVVWNQGHQAEDFYGTDASCVETVRREFRTHKTPQEVEVAIDEAFQLLKAISERVQLLIDEHDGTQFQITEPAYFQTFAAKYSALRAEETAQNAEKLDRALELIDGASKMLTNPSYSSKEKASFAKSYYRESLKAYETAEANAYLAYHYYLDEDLESAEQYYQRAMELDPLLGNTYNDLALVRKSQDRMPEALKLLAKAKAAPRYDARHYPNLQLAEWHLTNDRVRPALLEYIEALHWLGPEEGTAMRNTVTDMATYMVILAEKRGTQFVQASRTPIGMAALVTEYAPPSCEKSDVAASSNQHFELIEDGLPLLKSSDVKQKLLQWNLDGSLQLKRFRVLKQITPANHEQLINEFFAADNVQSLLSFPPEFSGAVPKGIQLRKLHVDVTSMAFFDKLEDAGLVSSSGSLRRCMDELYDGATASDLLKEMLINPDSEAAGTFTEDEQQQFIFQLMRAFVIGGSMSQPDESFEPYAAMTKDFYKALVSVKKNASDRSVIDVTSHVYVVEDEKIFPAPSPFNTCFLVIDPKKRWLTVWYNYFQPFW
ncbi:TPA: hypothetical protein N0F65_012568 [Lagenidium giganteum]|uniref:Cilia- and flagella-associated protein 300 n=1 Tax=Lagenidium giganteum TaxID=4803 RepID=A0AAV2YR45_9STRA|nr:TPA: hypothetical protein N0F65_012568 [Lagenidium giganteum]